MRYPNMEIVIGVNQIFWILQMIARDMKSYLWDIKIEPPTRERQYFGSR